MRAPMSAGPGLGGAAPGSRGGGQSRRSEGGRSGGGGDDGVDVDGRVICVFSVSVSFVLFFVDG